MPSGKVHDRITVVTTVAAVPAWWLFNPGSSVTPLIIVLGAYVFSGFWLSDDLDTNSVSYKRWGALRWLWWPYRKLVPHRSWISHGIGVGPIVRVIYFAAMLWAVARAVLWVLNKEGIPVNRNALLESLWQHGVTWTFAHPTWTLWALTGLVLGGIAHSLADAIVSFVKKVW